MASSEQGVGFEPADRLAQDSESVRRRFWIKFKQGVAKLAFAEGLLAGYYCPFCRVLSDAYFAAAAGRTCARALRSASHVWNCLNNASRSPSLWIFAAVAGLCLRNSSNLVRVTASTLWLFSHCSA